VALLRRLQDQIGGGGPLGLVGVLSRADEIGGPAAGRHDALDAARRRTDELRTDPELSGLHRDFVAVSGLLALRGQTLRQREFTALTALAGLPDQALTAALISTGRFISAELPVPAEGRVQLLEAFGVVGIRVAVELIRAGARDAPSLAAELVRHSGLGELRRILDARFGSRHGQLKAHAALTGVRRVLRRLPAARTARLLRSVELLLAGEHATTELRALGALSTLPVPERTRRVLELALGGRGIAPNTRLGLPTDASPAELRSAALAAIGYWRQQLGYPLLDPLTERAYRAAVRSCEAIVQNAA